MVNKILHYLYTIVCHLYITIEISNLYNDTWKMKKVFKNFVLKIDGGSSLSVFNSFRLWHIHNTNMPQFFILVKINENQYLSG
jgi:hypothetical protein